MPYVYKGERRKMTPENLTPIIALFDERFAELKKELKESQREYVTMLEKTYAIKIETVCRDVEDLKNSDDYKHLEDKLNERFLTKMDILNTSVKNLENTVVEKQIRVEKRLDEHDVKIEKLQHAESERAKKLVQKVKDNALAWIIPTLLIILSIALGLQIPGLGK
jgi:hypothetical protein